MPGCTWLFAAKLVGRSKHLLESVRILISVSEIGEELFAYYGEAYTGPDVGYERPVKEQAVPYYVYAPILKDLSLECEE